MICHYCRQPLAGTTPTTCASCARSTRRAISRDWPIRQRKRTGRSGACRRRRSLRGLCRGGERGENHHAVIQTRTQTANRARTRRGGRADEDRRYAKGRAGIVAAVPRPKWRFAQQSRSRKAQGGRRQAWRPLITCSRSVAVNTSASAIELKASGGRVEPEQRDWLTHLQSQGWVAVMAYGAVEAGVFAQVWMERRPSPHATTAPNSPPICTHRARIPHRMSQPCKSWSTGDRATPVPVLEGWQCAGCRWLPRADMLRFAQITTDPAVDAGADGAGGAVERGVKGATWSKQARPGRFVSAFRMNPCPICGASGARVRRITGTSARRSRAHEQRHRAPSRADAMTLRRSESAPGFASAWSDGRRMTDMQTA